jgi:hypothetical protein
MEYSLATIDNVTYQMVPVMPGLLQYSVTEDILTSFDVDAKKLANIDYNEGFVLDSHTQEHIHRLTPQTATGKKNKDAWKVILAIKKIEGDKICLKAALRNTITNEISLITSLNTSFQKGCTWRMIKTYDEDFKVCHCKMIAPLLFWDELKNRLLQ